MPGRSDAMDLPLELKRDLPGETLDLLRLFGGISANEVVWNTRCLTGKAKGIRGLVSNLDGTLIATSKLDCVYFATSKGWRGRLYKVPLDGAQVEIESSFLSENVTVAAANSRTQFCFPRGQGDKVELVGTRLREMILRKHPGALHEAEPVQPESIIETRSAADAPPELAPGTFQEQVAPVPSLE